MFSKGTFSIVAALLFVGLVYLVAKTADLTFAPPGLLVVAGLLASDIGIARADREPGCLRAIVALTGWTMIAVGLLAAALYLSLGSY